MPRRCVSIFIVPENAPRSLKFKLPFFAARLILVVLAFLVLFVVVLSILHGRLLYEVILGKSLRQENQRLKTYSAKVAQLEKELSQYQTFVQRVAELAGVEYQGSTGVHAAYYDEDIGLEELEMTELPMDPLDSAPQIAELGLIPSDSLRQIPRGVPIEGWITQGFKANLPDFVMRHPGVDFAARVGTEVRATADGTVTLADWDDTYGNVVAIDHGNGYVTYYGHNSKNLVKQGDKVSRGEIIALSGNTGKSSAPHLHYEIRQNDVPVDPGSFLKPAER